MLVVVEDWIISLLLTLVVLFGIGFLAILILLPKAAKTLLGNRFRKHALAAVAYDDGHVELKQARVYPEGILQTREKDPQYFMLPRKIADENVNPEETKALHSMEEKALKVFRLNGQPIFFCYAGKAVAATPTILAGLKMLPNGGTPKTKQIVPLDPLILKKYFTSMWNQSQIKSLARIREEIGYRKAKRQLKELITPLLIIGIVIIIGAILIKMM